MKRHGAVGNKLMSFHSDMSDFGHKNMDKDRGFHGDMSEWRSSVDNKTALAVWFT